MSKITLMRSRESWLGTPARTLIRAGAEASMVEEFRALAEATSPQGAPRYSARAVLEPLARFLVRGSANVNRDAALYELCHLVNAVGACGLVPTRRNAFFLEPEQASAAQFKARFDRALTEGGWRRAGFTQLRDGVAVAYADVSFMVHFSRMPFLAALYEFLAGMESFAFYPELQSIFDEMMAGSADTKALQTASNRIASRLRLYRRRNIGAAQQDGKFDLIFGFLMGRSPSGRVVIDDASVLDFWCAQAGVGAYRAYRTVFDAFAAFIGALEEAQHAEAMATALPIGTDRANGEVEPEDACTLADAQGKWVSPLARLDEEPAAAIKFLKKEGERKPIETLMHYGPMAIRLPLAFLRLETFGPIQSAITTDLQVGRGQERVAARTGCGTAVSYPETVANLTRILELIRRLQKATFYALHKAVKELEDEPVECADPQTMEKLLIESAKTFKAIVRKGFDEAGLGDEHRAEGFRIGAGALVDAADQIVRYLAALGRIGRAEGLERRFAADCTAFSKQFVALYGVWQ